MSAEIESARRILLAEQRDGLRDRVVVGGLSGFVEKWRGRVATSRDGSAMAVAQRVGDLLERYATLAPPERGRALEQALAALGGDGAAAPRAAERAGSRPALAPAPREVKRSTPPRNPPSATTLAPSTPISVVKFIRQREAQLLSRLGITTLGDLLWHYPNRHERYPPTSTASDLFLQQVGSYEGIVQDVEITPAARGGLHRIVATIADRTGRVVATWFRHARFSPVKVGQRVAVSGVITPGARALSFENPEWERADGEPVHTRRMVPVYPLTAGLSERWLRERIKWAVDAFAGRIADPLPEEIRREHNLWPLEEAVRQLHFPDSEADLAIARQRLAFDELLTIQLVVVKRKHDWQGAAALPLAATEPAVAALLDSQPYRLTGGQQRVLDEIYADIAKTRPMIRLLQGEVGSGKTAVAATALFVAVAAGAQGSLMAPTEILAEQHFSSLNGFYERARGPLESLGLPVPRVALLTGSVKGKRRREVYEAAAQGEIDVLVGTQAVIQQDVEFARLGLAVVDEQHRFGVRQRVALREKGGHPHVLVMTATPIPRTLALSLYGDLDLSVIDEMPPGRQQVRTLLLSTAERPHAYRKIRDEVAKGHQAFVICPLVDDSPNLEARAATQEFARLQESDLADLRLGLLHGRMKPAQKDSVMRAFRDREFDVLVSTAVVEVGVDIPNATVMLIEGAERFGLAQLHQFRGRVGRGSAPAVCLLLSDEESETATQRLQVVEHSSSGLELADYDLRQRGPGDYFGVRQSGLPELRIATLDDAPLVERARQAAQSILLADPSLELHRHAGLAARVAAFREQSGEPN
ncbi:MAG: ATP-dependent DNA helicase RecG [Chloroflexota bacterium]